MRPSDEDGHRYMVHGIEASGTSKGKGREGSVIGRGTWLDLVAHRVLEREERLGRSLDLLRVESGLGASGIPHVGSVGDAIRAYGVMMALEDRGQRCELIAFSDDMDGLRKVPEGLPSWLEEHLCRPVSSIPDPLDCHRSYGDHMSWMLRDALDALGVRYTFKSATEAYSQGLLTNEAHEILSRAEEVGRKIAEMVGQTKFEEVLPYYPLCSNCHRLYVAQAYSYLPKERKVLYRCLGSKIGYRFVEGCGHEGEASIIKGEGKLSWKVEFAARWRALDVRFEAYGKDIADSVKINDWVSEAILGYPPPYHVRYELFLDKSGKKISKSLGNVFTPQAWLRYGSKESLMLLMFKRIQGARHLSLEDIPNYMDEHDQLEEFYFSRRALGNPKKEAQLRGLYEYIHHLHPPPSPAPHVNYRLLVELARYAPEDKGERYVLEKLKQYGVLKGGDEADPRLLERIRLAMNWARELEPPSAPRVEVPEQVKIAIRDLAQRLVRLEDADAIQSSIFEVARAYGLEAAEFFKWLYRLLIGSDRGPRLGRYIADLGKERVSRLLLENL